MRDLRRDPPEGHVLGEPARLELAVPAADVLLRRFGEIPEHVRHHAGRFGVAERTAGRQVPDKIVMLDTVVVFDAGDVHEPIIAIASPNCNNPARYRAGLRRISRTRVADSARGAPVTLCGEVPEIPVVKRI